MLHNCLHEQKKEPMATASLQQQQQEMKQIFSFLRCFIRLQFGSCVDVGNWKRRRRTSWTFSEVGDNILPLNNAKIATAPSTCSTLPIWKQPFYNWETCNLEINSFSFGAICVRSFLRKCAFKPGKFDLKRMLLKSASKTVCFQDIITCVIN